MVLHTQTAVGGGLMLVNFSPAMEAGDLETMSWLTLLWWTWASIHPLLSPGGLQPDSKRRSIYPVIVGWTGAAGAWIPTWRESEPRHFIWTCKSWIWMPSSSNSVSRWEEEEEAFCFPGPLQTIGAEKTVLAWACRTDATRLEPSKQRPQELENENTSTEDTNPWRKDWTRVADAEAARHTSLGSHFHS